MTIEHPYAALLRAIADGRALQFECSNSEFIDLAPQDALEVLSGARHSPKRLRIKPAMIRIGDQELPAPMCVEPALRSRYFVLNLTEPSGCFGVRWDGDNHDARRLQQGLCFASEADAVAVAAALLGLLQPSGVQA